MSEETTTIQTGMKWDVLLSAVGMKCEGNALFADIKNPSKPNPPYASAQEGGSAEKSADTNTKKENSSTTKTEPQKGE